jgi:hypothetical protein
MRWTRRRPRLLPIPYPRLDGSSWPDAREAGTASFAAATLYDLARREAFTPEAHDVIDPLVEAVLPLVATGAAAADEAHLHRVLVAAAQIGAGIGLVERRTVQDDVAGTDRSVAGVLWMAAEDLPAMPTAQRRLARYLLQCGYFLARTGPAAVPELVDAVRGGAPPG